MAKTTKSKSKPAPADGPATTSAKTYPVRDDWKAMVEARLDELGLSKADLARMVGCSKAALTQLFSVSRKSELVPEINAAIGWERESSLLFGEDPSFDDAWSNFAEDLDREPLQDVRRRTPSMLALDAASLVEVSDFLRRGQERYISALRLAEDELRLAQAKYEKAKRWVDGSNDQISVVNRVFDVMTKAERR